MSNLVYEALRGWASIPTWRTSHPTDERRFNEAIAMLDDANESDVTEDHIRSALRRYRDETTEIWGGKASNQEIEDYVVRVQAARACGARRH